MIWYVLFGLLALFVIASVLRFILAVIIGVKHRNDPDPPLSGWDR